MVIPVVLAFGPADAVQLALLVAAGPLFAVIGAAMFPLSSLGADAAGVSHVTVMGLLGVVWAAGFAVVPLVLGAVAETTSTATAFTLASLLCLPALVLLVISVRRLGALAAVHSAA
jgi:fucose permease